VYSLGETPYRGLRAEQVLMSIMDGRRMERPALCPTEVFGIVGLRFFINIDAGSG
jgi:hypothetical protein